MNGEARWGTARSEPKINGGERHLPGQWHQPDAKSNKQNGQFTHASGVHLAVGENADDTMMIACVRVEGLMNRRRGGEGRQPQQQDD